MKASEEEVGELVRTARPLLEPSKERADRVREALLARMAREAAGGRTPSRTARSLARYVGLAVVVALVGGVFALRARPEGDAHRESLPPSSAPAVVVEVAAASPAVDVASLPTAPPVVSAMPVQLPTRAGTTARAERAKPESDSLEGEIRCLREARAALAKGDAAGALRALDRHAAEYPSGVLTEERRATRALVLCSLGREAEARAESRALVRSAPESPHLARLRQSCAPPEER